MLLTIKIIVLFIIFSLYLSSSKGGDEHDWQRALLLSLALPLLGFLPDMYDTVGWVIAIVLSFILISKFLSQSIFGAIFFLIVIGIIQYLIEIGVSKYL